MKFIIMLTLCFNAFSLIAQTDKVVNNYRISPNNECAIEFGRIQSSATKNGKFGFRIDISNKIGYEGHISGYAKFVTKNKAVFTDEECGALTFYFLPNNLVRIQETNCSYHHGANICFSGEYKKYISK